GQGVIAVSYGTNGSVSINCTSSGGTPTPTPPTPTPATATPTPTPMGTPSDDDQDGDGYTPAQGDCNDHDATIYPGTQDEPDMSFVDKNCDGIDGNAVASIFVSVSGSDTNDGTMSAPMRTVNGGIGKALALGKQYVLIRGG